MITEFGATDDLVAIANVLGAANDQAIGWMYWTYSAGHEITSLLLAKPVPGGSNNAQALVYYPTQELAGTNVNEAKRLTLAEPYPQVIAGIPQPWSFTKSASTGTLTFSYSTEMASGQGRFPVGSQTVIAVPNTKGYQASVTGGHVVSAPNAPQLVIASDAGADVITVVVNVPLS